MAARKRRNPKWPFDKGPEHIEMVSLDPANLYQRLLDGKPCVLSSCRRTLDRIREPGACTLCRSVMRHVDEQRLPAC